MIVNGNGNAVNDCLLYLWQQSLSHSVYGPMNLPSLLTWKTYTLNQMLKRYHPANNTPNSNTLPLDSLGVSPTGAKGRTSDFGRIADLGAGEAPRLTRKLLSACVRGSADMGLTQLAIRSERLMSAAAEGRFPPRISGFAAAIATEKCCRRDLFVSA